MTSALRIVFAAALCACTGRISDPLSFESAGRGSAGRPVADGGIQTVSGAGGSSAPTVAGSGGAGAGTSAAMMGLAGMGAAGSAGATGSDTGPGTPSTSDNGITKPPATNSATRLYGVTIDSIDKLDQIMQSLQMLSRKPTTRIVFDENVPASQYSTAVARIHTVSGVMGEVLDSYYVKDSATDDYAARVTEYLDMLDDDVDIWEIGNEVNGDWLGTSKDVHDKITDAYRQVHARHKPAALTLYYNQGCVEQPDHEMFRWADANVDAELKSGLEYVLISYYEDDCKNLQPDWPTVFSRLATMFPNSKLGFGECGTKDASKKAEYIQRYYQLQIALPQYIGGYFWWYFHQDMLPYTSKLWSVLDQTLQTGP